MGGLPYIVIPRRLVCLGILFLVLGVRAQGERDTLRVMSFNILHGATVKNDFNLDTLAGVIRRFDPDMVALQEVDFMTHRAKKMDLATELGLRVGMAPLFGRAMDYDGGAYGEAVLSKYTFLSSENISLPHLPTSEPRAALKTVVRTKNGNHLALVGTHLDHLEEDTDRVMQARALVAALKDVDMPLVLLGDLNDVPGSRPLEILRQLFIKPDHEEAHRATWPAHAPTMNIDHILYDKKHHWEVLAYGVHCENYASDHCIVYATLVFTP
ncbi:endonuclease/exonuclease/phosphatase family protein [Maribacter sp. 2307ULW6-5]|uniref:endonuclease/exonuclease/phosphatase family protein n=1 Tax=Maribacter sp. 2307ULW6-5 TaxID=3386275 RepID=UPI0039BD1CD4